MLLPSFALLNPDSLWLMEPSALARLASLPVKAAERCVSPPPPLPSPLSVEGGLATLSIHGPILRQASGLTRLIHAALGEPLAESGPLAGMIAELQNSPNIKVVLLDIDSPGGTVNGTPELAAAVARLSRTKHVYAYTAGLCCSAAYWVASQCDAIYAAPSSRLGSIGVILQIQDTAGALHRSGIQVETFTAGKFKGTGAPGTSLSEEQRSLLQQQVESTWADFRAAVNRRRNVAEDKMEGQTFSGSEAKAFGLADARADSLTFLQEKLLARHCSV